LNKLTTLGSTNLFAAVESALQKMKKAKHRTRALVLISDGIAGGDLKSLSRNIVDSETLIYTFCLLDKQTANVAQPVGGFPVVGGFGAQSAQLMSTPNQILETLATNSGGSSQIFDVADLDTAILQMVKFDQNIVAEMRGQYTVEYVSKTSGGPAGHSIRLKVTSPDYKLRARRNTASAAKPQ